MLMIIKVLWIPNFLRFYLKRIIKVVMDIIESIRILVANLKLVIVIEDEKFLKCCKMRKIKSLRIFIFLLIPLLKRFVFIMEEFLLIKRALIPSFMQKHLKNKGILVV
mgnify:CR=1 FL=1